GQNAGRNGLVLFYGIANHLLDADDLPQLQHEYREMVLLDQNPEHGVAGDIHYGFVKPLVVAHEFGEDRRPHWPPALFDQAFEDRAMIALVDIQGRLPRSKSLECLSDFEQVPHMLGGEAADNGASVGNHFHPTVGFQAPERLAQGTSSHAEPL